MHSVHSLHWGSCGEHPAPIKNKDGVASMYTVHWLCSALVVHCALVVITFLSRPALAEL